MSTTNRPGDAAAGDPALLLRPAQPGGRGRRASSIGANLAMIRIMASVVGLLLGVVVLVELLT